MATLPHADARPTVSAPTPATLGEAAHALGGPTRYRVFRQVYDADEAVSVIEIADALGVHPNAVRRHLAELADAGLVEEATERRTTPGRPRLLYRVRADAATRWGAESPYERLAVLLLEVVTSGDTPFEVGRRAGRAASRHRQDGDDALAWVAAEFRRQGFDPDVETRDGTVTIVLGNCPYVAAAAIDPQTVCALHRGLADGMVGRARGLRVQDLEAESATEAGCRLILARGSQRQGTDPD